LRVILCRRIVFDDVVSWLMGLDDLLQSEAGVRKMFCNWKRWWCVLGRKWVDGKNKI